MTDRRRTDALLLQEMRWKGSKARTSGDGFNLFYHGIYRKENRLGAILN